jgi:hypothetical protein
MLLPSRLIVHSNAHLGSNRFYIYTYDLAAASLVVFNKIALSKYNFPYANIMVLCQVYALDSN